MYGAFRAFDNITTGSSTGAGAPAQSSAAVDPYMVLNLGQPLTNITMVQVFPNDFQDVTGAQNLVVYLSAGADYTVGGVACNTNPAILPAQGQTHLISCDKAAAQIGAAQYVTIVKKTATPDYLLIMEVKIFQALGNCPYAPPSPPAPAGPKTCGDGFVFITVDDADDGGHAEPGKQGDLYSYAMVKAATHSTANPATMKGILVATGCSGCWAERATKAWWDNACKIDPRVCNHPLSFVRSAAEVKAANLFRFRALWVSSNE